MKIVLPFFEGDQWLLMKHLDWMAELDPKIDYEAYLACDDTFDPTPAHRRAAEIFRSVRLIRYPRAYHNGQLMLKWPWQQNNSFANVCRAMEQQRDCWFWLETDCAVLKPGWAKAIETEYLAGKKPFGGHWNEKTSIFNGVAVYPPNVGIWCEKALLAAITINEKENNYQPPWDAFMSQDVYKHLHVMNNVMQHFWTLPGQDQAPHFDSIEMVQKWVRPEVYVYHRCKDGSLIDRLREANNLRKQLVLHGTDVVHPPKDETPVPLPVIPVPPEPIKQKRNRKRIPTRPGWKPNLLPTS